MDRDPRNPRRVAVAAIVGCLAIVATACGSDDQVVLGTDPGGGIEVPTLQVPGAADLEADPSTTEPETPPEAAADGTSEADGESGAESPEPPAEEAAPTPEPTVPPVRPVAVPDSLSLTLTKMANVTAPLALVTRSGSPLLYAATKGGLVYAIETANAPGPSSRP